MGNMFGSVVVAAMLTVLPEMLREFGDYRMLAYAIVLILVMIITNNDTIKSYGDIIKAKFGLSKEKGKGAKAK